MRSNAMRDAALNNRKSTPSPLDEAAPTRVDYRALFERANVGIFRLDASRKRFIEANPAAATIFGCESPQELQESARRREGVFVESGDWERLLLQLSRACDTGDAGEVEAEICCKDGAKRSISVALFASKSGEGDEAHHDGVIHDITARKQAQESLRRLSARLLQLQDEERRRIARELHDGTGQDLAALEMTLVQLESSNGEALGVPERNQLSVAIALARQCSQQIRNLSYLLHPPLLDELGLDVAVREFVEGFSVRTELPIEAVVSADLPRLRPEVETALFRIVQECLVNVHRHSGSASAAVRLVRDNDAIRLEIRDRGRGIDRGAFDDESVGDLGVGIRGMGERMHQLGGRLRIESGPNGTTVSAELPTALGRLQD